MEDRHCDFYLTGILACHYWSTVQYQLFQSNILSRKDRCIRINLGIVWGMDRKTRSVDIEKVAQYGIAPAAITFLISLSHRSRCLNRLRLISAVLPACLSIGIQSAVPWFVLTSIIPSDLATAPLNRCL